MMTATAFRAFGAESKGTLPDVLIQAEEKRPVAREKPPLKMDVKEDAPLEALLRRAQDEVESRIPSEIAQSTGFVAGTSNSPKVAVPSTHWIISPWKGEMARVFYPLQELSKVYPSAGKEDKAKGRWELIVVDSGGKPFRRFSGSGLAPERVEFDGRSDEGAWLKTGQAYTGVLTCTDPSGRNHTAMGKPFGVAGLNLQDSKGASISLAPRLMFSKEGGPQLSAQGTALLQEAAVLIQRHYPGLGLKVEARLSRSDPEWVQGAGDAAAQLLAKRLLTPPSALPAAAFPSTKDLEERLDVLILNR